MRVLLLATLAGLLSPILLVHPALGAPGAGIDEQAVIAAVPVTEGNPGPYAEPTSAQVARFMAELPGALTQAGLSVMDARLADVKLADHLELLNCRGEDCLLSQAQLLGTRKLVVPHLRALPEWPGLRIELSLFAVTPAPASGAPRLQKQAESVEICSPCRLEALPPAVSRAVAQLLRPEPAPAPLLAQPLLPASHRRQFRAAKWALFGVGLAAMVVGTALWALDGNSAPCDKAPGQVRCPLLYDTKGGGVAIFATGTAVLGASAVLFGLDARRGNEGAPSTMLTMSGRF